MNQIDFLPSRFHKRRARQDRAVWEFTLCAAVAIVLVLATVTMHARSAILRDAVESAEGDAKHNETQARERDRLTNSRRALAKQLHVYRMTALPIDTADVLASIAELAPPGITLNSMRMRSKEYRPSGKPTPIGSPKEPETGWVALSIELDAVAPSDDQIVDFVAKLERHPAFEGVKIRHSRAGEVAGYAVREFRLDLSVPLDRDYKRKHPHPTSQEVAHAD